MTLGSAEPHPAPVLVLGLGNLLLRDDGVGLELLRRLEAEMPASDRVEFLDGGTQGIALLSFMAGRQALLILDAVALGDSPGTVHAHEGPDFPQARPGITAHEGNAGELLATAQLIGDLPEKIHLVGIEPDEIRTGIGLSPAVAEAVPRGVKAARRALEALIEP
ncbi:MAG: hydrogenase maturation protease [Thermoanaerobaculales bacterium]